MRDLTLVSYKMMRESKEPSPGKKSRRGARFSFHICRYKIEMIMSHESLFFLKKTVNEYFWNCPSKQIDPFDYLCRTFLWKIIIIGKNEKFLLTL